VTSAFTTVDKWVSKTGHIQFFSHTALEDISADNYKVTSSLDPTTGAVIYSVPMQSFEFPNATMQKHFNGKKFLLTKKYPKAKFKGVIDDLSAIDFDTNGEYIVSVTGEMTIKDVTKSITENGTITITDDAVITKTSMQLTLADYGIAFKKGKPSTNIAKTIEVTAHMEYKK
jgi:polyisoprenoid-binding protein YceI